MRFLRSAFLLALSLAATLSAVEPQPETDAALRARIKEFYQLQVDRKFRQAEQLVASDTKDFYYESRKPDLRSIKITEIKYEPDFQSAKVTLASQMQIMIPGTAPRILDIPFSSLWKIEGNEWCWYVDQTKLRDTPFGKVKAKGDGANQELSKLEERISTAGLMDGVHVDPTVIELDPSNPQVQTIKLKNSLPGPVTVQSLTNSAALKVEIAKPNLGAEESTEATVTFVAGNNERPGQVTLRILPMGQIIAVPIHYPVAQ